MSERKERKVRVGVVVSSKGNKTAVVRVKSQFVHTKYKKIIRTSKKYYAHDEKNECSAGDLVQIHETRPLSKTKRWYVSSILKRAV